jgi:hypothetical protein
MPFTLFPHEITKDVSGLPLVRHRADYVILCNAGQKVYVQQGEVYQSFDYPLPRDEYPSWFWDSYRRLTPSTRRAVGLELPEDKVQSLEELPAAFLETLDRLSPSLRAQLIGEKASRIDEKAPQISAESSDMDPLPEPLKNDSEAPRLKTWTCEECSEDMPLRLKGVHKAGHARARKHAERRAS